MSDLVRAVTTRLAPTMPVGRSTFWRAVPHATPRRMIPVALRRFLGGAGGRPVVSAKQRLQCELEVPSLGKGDEWGAGREHQTRSQWHCAPMQLTRTL